MSLQDIDVKQSQKKGEDDSMAWQNYAVEKLVDLESAIQDMVHQKDILPIQLLEVANAILKTLSGLNSLKNHRKDFERLLGEASTFLVVFWQLYIETKVKYPPLGWPPPKLRDLLDELVVTTCRIHRLMGRKSEKNLAKRVLLGCFGIRDLGKFNKYQQRLGNMTLSLQSKPHNINFHAVLLALVHSRAQPQDEDSDSELTGELEGDLPDKKSAKEKATDKKPTAEGSRASEMGKSTTAKPVIQRMKSEEDSQRKSNKAKNETKCNSKHEREEERSAEDKSARTRMDRRNNCDEGARENQDKSKTMRYEPDKADLLEGTSMQGSLLNNAAQSKTRKKPSQAHEDEKIIRDTAPKRRGRSRTNPVSPRTPGPPSMHQAAISDFTFINGSGTMINENIGNTYNLTR